MWEHKKTTIIKSQFYFYAHPNKPKKMFWNRDKCMKNVRKKEMQVTNGKGRQIQGKNDIN